MRARPSNHCLPILEILITPIPKRIQSFLSCLSFKIFISSHLWLWAKQSTDHSSKILGSSASCMISVKHFLTQILLRNWSLCIHTMFLMGTNIDTLTCSKAISNITSWGMGHTFLYPQSTLVTLGSSARALLGLTSSVVLYGLSNIIWSMLVTPRFTIQAFLLRQLWIMPVLEIQRFQSM